MENDRTGAVGQDGPLPQSSITPRNLSAAGSNLSVDKETESSQRVVEQQETVQGPDASYGGHEDSRVSTNPSPPMSAPPAYKEHHSPPLFSSSIPHDISTPLSIPMPVSTPTSAPISTTHPPLSADDELPVYDVPRNDLSFVLSANLSTTYTVIPSQGPAEFRAQTRQLQHETVDHPTATRTAPTDRVSQPVTRTQPHLSAWTLEYWVDDTIQYLCYLMDPKLSTMNEPMLGATVDPAQVPVSTSSQTPTAEPSAFFFSIRISTNNVSHFRPAPDLIVEHPKGVRGFVISDWTQSL